MFYVSPTICMYYFLMKSAARAMDYLVMGLSFRIVTGFHIPVVDPYFQGIIDGVELLSKVGTKVFAAVYQFIS